MTLLGCQIFSTVAREGSFIRTAEQMNLTPSAISHAVAGLEAECGFPLFTRTKTGVTMTAAAENLLPAVRRLLASGESLDQSIAQVNGMHKGVLRLAVFNSACVAWVPQLVPEFEREYPGIEVKIYQGSYADVAAWLKNGTAELGFLSGSSAKDLAFEPLCDDPLVCIAPFGFKTRRPGHVTPDELRSQTFVSQRADTDADLQSYLKRQDLRVRTSCYVIDDESTVAMVACGQGIAIMPSLTLTGHTDADFNILALDPPASRTIGLACLDRKALSPAARRFAATTKALAGELNMADLRG